MTQPTDTSTRNNSVLLKDLLSASDLNFLDIAHLESEVDAVSGVVLILSLDELSTVFPNTLLVLTDQVTRRGWMVTSAIRYAWERHAVGVVIKGKAHSTAAVLLAERLGVTVLLAEKEATDAALHIAMQLGSSRAELGRDIQNVQAHLESVRTPSDALLAVAEALPGAKVELVRPKTNETVARHSETIGTVADVAEWSRAEALPSTASPQSQPEAVRVEQRIFDTGAEADRVTVVVTTTTEQQADAQRLLRAAIPYFKSLFLQEQLDELTDALPIISMVTPMTAGEGPPLLPNEDQLNSEWDRLEKRLTAWGQYVSVCVNHPSPGQVAASVVNGWRGLRDRTALIKYSGGWLGFASATEVSGSSDGLNTVLWSGSRLGVSKPRDHSSGRDGMTEAVHESVLAAGMAASPGAKQTDRHSAVVAFDQIVPAMLARVIPGGVAEELLATQYPDFASMKGRDTVTETVLAYFQHHGSVSAAATATGVHRNTVQARLREARANQLPIDDPESVLGLHMLLAATRQAGEA
jgi:hypothetical protein